MTNPPYGFMDTSFKAAGKVEGISQLVERFYFYMNSEDFAHSLRAMHSDDLTEAKKRLTWFITGWLGGPKHYHENVGSINIPGFHRQFPITPIEANAWRECMIKAIKDQTYAEDFKVYLIEQFSYPLAMIIKSQSASK
ncbi:MAG: globin [Cellvibrionales bacterium]|nr:globin [Cellvibrionales bacterium]